HFSPGNGHYTLSLNLEWWYRSEFPFIIGILGNYKRPLNSSKAGFKSGQKLLLNLQAIRQKALFGRAFPYFKLKIRDEFPDYWENKKAPNSGGILVDGTVALDFEISESQSAILSLDLPIWQSFEGSQLVDYILSISLRKILN
ncbi:MAG: hypothetical protein SCK70_13450, partial [bacterium]|nr:hypothetical protein [bacterium]